MNSFGSHKMCLIRIWQFQHQVIYSIKDYFKNVINDTFCIMIGHNYVNEILTQLKNHEQENKEQLKIRIQSTTSACGTLEEIQSMAAKRPFTVGAQNSGTCVKLQQDYKNYSLKIYIVLFVREFQNILMKCVDTLK